MAYFFEPLIPPIVMVYRQIDEALNYQMVSLYLSPSLDKKDQN